MDLKKAAVAGAATLATAWGLQQAYKVTDIYPPEPVFWFAIGATAHLALSALLHSAAR